jgi:hypothetical protein
MNQYEEWGRVYVNWISILARDPFDTSGVVRILNLLQLRMITLAIVAQNGTNYSTIELIVTCDLALSSVLFFCLHR